MKPLPKTENAQVIRTDFSDPAAWERISTEIQAPVNIYQANPKSSYQTIWEKILLKFITPSLNAQANVKFIDDPIYQDMSKDQLLQLVPRDYNHSFFMIADHIAIYQPGSPLLIVDLVAEPGREFRAIPSQVQAIENNLSIANMDFEDFAGAVDEDGIFRGFRKG